MKKNYFSLLLLLFIVKGFSQQNATNTSESKVSISFAAGPSFRLASIPSNVPQYLKSYIEELKSGFSYDFGFTYMVNNNSGFGVKTNLYKSKGAVGTVNLTAPNGDTGYGTASDNISIFYVGPTYTFFGKEGKSKDRFSSLFSIGYMSYLNKSDVLGKYDIKGSSIGFNAEIAYFLGITKNLQIAPRVALFGGALNQFKISGENGYTKTLNLGNTRESLWRIDPSVSLKYNF